VQGKPRKIILGFVAWLLAALVPHWALSTAQLPVSWIRDVLVIVFFGAELPLVNDTPEIVRCELCFKVSLMTFT